jgi:hypothetical protein
LGRRRQPIEDRPAGPTVRRSPTAQRRPGAGQLPAQAPGRRRAHDSGGSGVMFPRRHRHAVHSVYAEDEPLEAVEQQTARLPAPARLARQRRLAAMALLGAGVGIVAMLVAHGLRAPGAGGGVRLGPHPPGETGPVVAARLPQGAPAGYGEGGSQNAQGQRARPHSSAGRWVDAGAGGAMRGELMRAPGGSAGQSHTQARAAPKARGVGTVPGAHGAVSPPAAAVVVVATGAAGSELNFER